MPSMCALSVRQPYAELITTGAKTIEVRSWRTKHRGQIVICATGRWHVTGVRDHGKIGPLGVVACVVDLVDVRPMKRTDARRALCDRADCDSSLYSWVLENARRVEPEQVKGALGLFYINYSPILVASLSPST